LLSAILNTHTYHFSRNDAYRKSVLAKGLGEQIDKDDIVRLLRPTSQVFKSYIDIMGTSFPHHKPDKFIEWLEGNLSIPLPDDKTINLKDRYPSLEALLSIIEIAYSDLGLEIGTSSGTTGRATIMVHDNHSAEKAAEAYQHAVYSLWGTFNQHQFIFVMPSETRIVMARIARTATARLGMDAQAHFMIPFSATPDQVRIRSGRLFEPGFKGLIEQKFLYPFMEWMNENYVKSKYVNLTIDQLENFSQTNQNILFFGGFVQLHHIYQGLQKRGFDPQGDKLSFGNQSIIGTGGGMKEQYPYTPSQIIQELQSVLELENGNPMPHRDVYGMAEANWAAAQCQEGNYHIPPWVYAVIIDEEDQIVESSQATGLLAFYDPFTDMGLYPHFYKTADRVTLINGGNDIQPENNCPCGHSTSYLLKDSITRQDRLDEAGCAGQI
jgi:hypothetical protein